MIDKIIAKKIRKNITISYVAFFASKFLRLIQGCKFFSVGILFFLIGTIVSEFFKMFSLSHVHIYNLKY